VGPPTITTTDAEDYDAVPTASATAMTEMAKSSETEAAPPPATEAPTILRNSSTMSEAKTATSTAETPAENLEAPEVPKTKDPHPKGLPAQSNSVSLLPTFSGILLPETETSETQSGSLTKPSLESPTKILGSPSFAIDESSASNDYGLRIIPLAVKEGSDTKSRLDVSSPESSSTSSERELPLFLEGDEELVIYEGATISSSNYIPNLPTLEGTFVTLSDDAKLKVWSLQRGTKIPMLTPPEPVELSSPSSSDPRSDFLHAHMADQGRDASSGGECCSSNDDSESGLSQSSGKHDDESTPTKRKLFPHIKKRRMVSFTYFQEIWNSFLFRKPLQEPTRAF
jgi:hypothetical protein